MYTVILSLNVHIISNSNTFAKTICLAISVLFCLTRLKFVQSYIKTYGCTILILVCTVIFTCASRRLSLIVMCMKWKSRN